MVFIKYINFFFVSDTTSYIVKAAYSLTMLFPNINLLTYLELKIYRISECLRN
jgi:hypothetical protein